MSHAQYVLLLGSAREDGQARVGHAIEQLRALGDIVAVSRLVIGPSVTRGDAHRYANQAVRLASAFPRAELAPALKQIETALGRQDGDEACAIDIDLAREYDAQGALRWENPAKLDHRLFVDLAAEVAPRGGAARA